MKNLGILLFISLLSIGVGCQEAELEELVSPDSISSYTFEQVAAIFDSLPKTGFASDNYEIANWDGSNRQKLPTCEHYLEIFQFSPFLLTPERREFQINRHYKSEGYNNLFFLIDSTLTESDDGDRVANIYLKGELILNAKVGINDLVSLQNGYPVLAASYLLMCSAVIDEHELLTKFWGYDFYADDAAIYLDGKIIFQNLPKEGTLPLSATIIKIWKDKFLVSLSSHASADGPEGFLIINPKTKTVVTIKKN